MVDKTPLIPLRFEDDHDDENDALVAGFGASSVERFAALGVTQTNAD
jgi:hypothetical protein